MNLPPSPQGEGSKLSRIRGETSNKKILPKVFVKKANGELIQRLLLEEKLAPIGD
jgi:hypothetical protein